jgi:hypothetical protein
MGRKYSIAFDNVTCTTANGDYDIFSILPAVGKHVRIHSIKLDNLQVVQDANEEMLRITVVRGHTTAPSGGTAATANPLHPDDAADAATCRYMDGTIASAGTAVTLAAFGWNVRMPFREVFTPEERPYCKNAEYIVVRLMAAPAATDPELSGTLVFEEV